MMLPKLAVLHGIVEARPWAGRGGIWRGVLSVVGLSHAICICGDLRLTCKVAIVHLSLGVSRMQVVVWLPVGLCMMGEGERMLVLQHLNGSSVAAAV
jgi:hypothetical protein